MTTNTKKTNKYLLAAGFILSLFGASKMFKSTECPICEQPKCHCATKAG